MNLSLLLPASGGCQHAFDCGHITAISASVFTQPLSCVSVSSSYLSPTQTLLLAFRAQLDNPGYSPQLMILHLITPSKVLLPNKVTFTVSKD